MNIQISSFSFIQRRRRDGVLGLLFLLLALTTVISETVEQHEAVNLPQNDELAAAGDSAASEAVASAKMLTDDECKDSAATMLEDGKTNAEATFSEILEEAPQSLENSETAGLDEFDSSSAAASSADSIPDASESEADLPEVKEVIDDITPEESQGLMHEQQYQKLERRLDTSYGTIAGLNMTVHVTDENNFDKDQALIVQALNAENWTLASLVYENGANSGSYAELTLTSPLGIEITAGGPALFTGKSGSGGDVYGTALETVETGATVLRIKYELDDNMGCLVAANPNPITNGCFAPEAEVVYNLVVNLPYTYDPMTDNKSNRTIHGLSAMADQTMRSPTGEYLGMFQPWVNYYNGTDFVDKIIKASMGKTKLTGLANETHDFSQLSTSERRSYVTNYTKFLYTLESMRLLELVALDCANTNATCQADESCEQSRTHVGQAWAFWVGSLQNYLGHAHADQMCPYFKTCGRSGNSTEGTSKVNLDLLDRFRAMSAMLNSGMCDGVEDNAFEAMSLMIVPLIQNTLLSAYYGETYPVSITALVHECTPLFASKFQDSLPSMNAGRRDTGDFKTVKSSIETAYYCLGVKCEDVGGIWNAADKAYFNSTPPCTIATAFPTQAPTKVPTRKPTRRPTFPTRPSAPRAPSFPSNSFPTPPSHAVKNKEVPMALMVLSFSLSVLLGLYVEG